MAESAQFPVRTLEDRIVAIEAALAVCLAGPNPRAVHRFRTEIRRLEAHLALLNAVPGVSPHKRLAATLMRHLHKLRHEAGETRDYDVQRRMLTPLLRTTSRSSEAEEQRKGVGQLIEHLADERSRAADDFQERARKDERKVARDLEALRKAVKDASDQRLSATAFLRAGQDYFERALDSKHGAGKHAVKLPKHPSHHRLHQLRKAAKIVRYIAEAAPSTKHATAFEQRFHALQDAGGHWHDWLQLAAESKALLGKTHPLTAHLVALRNRHRAAFLRSLESVPLTA